MQYRTLGRTGIKVSPYALGTLMFATSIGNPDHDDSIRIIHKALDAGINFVDTADCLRRVRGDRRQGAQGAPRQRGARDEVQPPDGRRPQPAGRLAALDHRPRSRTPCAACRPTTSTYTRSTGPIGHRHRGDAVGADRPDPQRQGPRDRLVERLPASDIVEAQWVAERRGLERFRTEQPPYSILNRGIEREVLPVAQRYGMGTLVWGPLGAGTAHRPRPQGPADRPAPGRPVPAISATSAASTPSSSSSRSPQEAGLPMTHLAMAFAIAHPGVTSATPRAAHHGAARRPARRHRRHAHRRDPRPDRRDRPARHRHRHARPSLPTPSPSAPRPPPPTRR